MRERTVAFRRGVEALRTVVHREGDEGVRVVKASVVNRFRRGVEVLRTGVGDGGARVVKLGVEVGRFRRGVVVIHCVVGSGVEVVGIVVGPDVGSGLGRTSSMP